MFVLVHHQQRPRLLQENLPAQLAADGTRRAGHQHDLAAGACRDQFRLWRNEVAPQQIRNVDAAKFLDLHQAVDDVAQCRHRAHAHRQLGENGQRAQPVGAVELRVGEQHRADVLARNHAGQRLRRDDRDVLQFPLVKPWCVVHERDNAKRSRCTQHGSEADGCLVRAVDDDGLVLRGGLPAHTEIVQCLTAADQIQRCHQPEDRRRRAGKFEAALDVDHHGEGDSGDRDGAHAGEQCLYPGVAGDRAVQTNVAEIRNRQRGNENEQPNVAVYRRQPLAVTQRDGDPQTRAEHERVGSNRDRLLHAPRQAAAGAAAGVTRTGGGQLGHGTQRVVVRAFVARTIEKCDVRATAWEHSTRLFRSIACAVACCRLRA